MKEVTYSVGQYFRYDKNNEVYILAVSPKLGKRVSLVSLKDGCLWNGDTEVSDYRIISFDELNNVSLNTINEFTLITKQQAAELLLTSNKTD